jgi:hypothetical protein
MGFLEIFRIIGEAVGLIKPYVDEKERKKKATGEAMKDNAEAPSPSIAGHDAFSEMDAEFDAEESAPPIDTAIDHAKNDQGVSGGQN